MDYHIASKAFNNDEALVKDTMKIFKNCDISWKKERKEEKKMGKIVNNAMKHFIFIQMFL